MRCPGCGAEMRQLFTTLYCAEAPSPATTCPVLQITVRHVPWRVVRVRRGIPCPDWPTHAWELNGRSPREDGGKSDSELISLLQPWWSGHEAPGWSIEENGRVAWTNDTLVFARIH